MKPTLSIVIPSYNRADQVEYCIRSCQQIDSVNCELRIVLVDDGSSDGTVSRLVSKFELVPFSDHWKSADDRLYLISILNSERGAARNTGARFAIETLNASALLFLDADDALVKEPLEQVLSSHSPLTEIVSGRYILWDGERTSRGPQPFRAAQSLTTPELAEMFFSGSPMPLGATIIPARCFTSIGGFVEDRELSGSEDWVFLFKCALRFTVVLVPDVMVLYRQHPQNTSPEKSAKSKVAAQKYIQACIQNYYKESSEQAMARIRFHHELMTVGGYISTGKTGHAARHLVSMILDKPAVLLRVDALRVGLTVLWRFIFPIKFGAT